MKPFAQTRLMNKGKRSGQSISRNGVALVSIVAFSSPIASARRCDGVASSQRYETSAVDYKLLFLLEFLFEENTPLETKTNFIKELQDFFNKI